MRYNNHRIPHILKKTKTLHHPSNFIFFDTETRDSGQADRERTERHKLWFGCAWAFRYEKGNPTRQAKLTFTTIDQFWQFLLNRTDKGRPLYVFAHNLGFDFTIIDGWHKPQKLGLETSYLVLEDPPMMLCYKYGDAKIIFIDTYNFWKCSVEDMGKSLNMKKLTMPKGKKLTKQWINYCRRDVEIIANQVVSLLDFLTHNELGSFGISAPSIAMHTFKTKFMNHEIYIHDRNSVLALERQGYYGGMVNNWFIGEIHNQPTYWVDVNSLYPYCMLQPVPTKLIDEARDVPMHKLKDKGYARHCIAECLIRDTKHTYPKRYQGRLCEVSGRFYTTLCGLEFEQAIQRNAVLHIKHLAAYEMQPIFKDYVTYFWRLRKQYKEKGDSVNETMVKLLMNSLYGKFGMKGYQWYDATEQNLRRYYALFGKDLPDEYIGKPLSIEKDKLSTDWHAFGLDRPIHLRYHNGVLEMKFPTGEHSESFCAIAAWITSYARHYLRSLVELANPANVYYCDTDSLFLNECGFRKLERARKINNKELGMLKLEGVANYCRFNGPKDYVFGGTVKKKGIKKTAKLVGENKYEQVQFEGTKSVMKRKGEAYIDIRMITKEIKSTYKKGIVSTSGRVSPFILSES